MTTRRTSPKAGWASVESLPKGQNGRCLCRQCGTEVPAGRQTFCSTACVHAWKLVTDPSYLRRKVFERDHGICAECGLDTFAGVPSHKRRSRGSGHLWQADHIVPVAEGGGECSLENMRSLCVACHRKATAALAARRAEQRRAARSAAKEAS